MKTKEELEKMHKAISKAISTYHKAIGNNLKESGKEERKELYFHKMLLNDKLPLSIGGGIGQSRLCMVMLHKAHIGETQASIWPDEQREECAKYGMHLI